MRQRGRKSAAQLATLSVNGDPPRLKPPADLADDERFLFSEIVTACGPRHFLQSDLPLLVTYVQATLLSRRAVANVGMDAAALALWEKTTRMQATLGAQREDTRIRIAIGFTAWAGAAELEARLRCG
jgi:hypothetical protein